MDNSSLHYRLLSQVRFTPQCWLWEGYTGADGYGRVSNSRKVSPLLVHRVSWMIFKGQIPEGLFICHRCDTPACVNPSHLFLGTGQDNVDDMISKGRENHRSNPKGAAHWKAKLTEELVKDIRDRYKIGDVSQRWLGNKYGVCRSTIEKVLNNKNWKGTPGGKLCRI